METRDFTEIFKPVVDKISRQLGLIFIPQNAPEGNVCFMTNPRLRQEFKTTFTLRDVINFVHAVLHSAVYRSELRDFEKVDLSQIRCPEDLDTFWELVRKGEDLRQ